MWDWSVFFACLVIALIVIYVVEPVISTLLFNTMYPSGALVEPTAPYHDVPYVVVSPVATHPPSYAAHVELVEEPAVYVVAADAAHDVSPVEHVSTLVFGVEAPNREAAAHAANHRGPVVRDVVSSSIPTRLLGNSNSSYGTLVAMKNENVIEDMHRFSASSPVFIFNSSTHWEDARDAHAANA